LKVEDAVRPYVDRRKRWVAASYSLAGIVMAPAVPVIQGLGQIDVELLPIDDLFALPRGEYHETEEATLYLNRGLIVGRLWVLGLYELVRAVNKRVRADHALVSDNTRARIATHKSRLERLRVPLA
jgi:hypothetical protein